MNLEIFLLEIVGMNSSIYVDGVCTYLSGNTITLRSDKCATRYTTKTVLPFGTRYLTLRTAWKIFEFFGRMSVTYGWIVTKLGEYFLHHAVNYLT